MKKKIQNVLAQNSTGEIAYVCGKCGKIIDKEDGVCKHCGARLGDIKCPFCGFRGTVADFGEDTCPRCGRKNNGTGFEAKKRRGKSGGYEPEGLSGRFFWIFFIILMVLNVFVLYLFLTYFNFI